MFAHIRKKSIKEGYALSESVVMSGSAKKKVAHTLDSMHKVMNTSDRMHKAAASNDLKTFVPLLEEDPRSLNQKDDNNWTPLHHAANNNSLDVLAVLLQKKPDLNVVTGQNETALHLAVREGHCTVIELLAQHEADGSIKNLQHHTPVHLAVLLRKYDCLKALLKDGKINSQVEGEHSMTALHLAACLDDITATKLLLDYGSYMCRRCAMGLTALHHAAKNGSKNVVNFLLEKAEAKGYTRAFLLSLQDNHKHSPLHLAINSGKTEPVKVCLEAGADIDSAQEDQSTAVHLVCSQPGTLEILKLMRKYQPDRFTRCMKTEDANGMTPLHRAALFDFSEVAEYLIQQGSPLNSVDHTGMSPLLIAASRQCWAIVGILCRAGVDFCVRDHNKSNFLHLAIKSGGDLADMWQCKESKNKSMWVEMMNESDVDGCTPLHYASKAGNLPSISGLINQGAVIACKDNSKMSPLHFASCYGRINTCRALLDTPQGRFITNEPNYVGKTPLHLASENGHVKVVALLMQRGALLHRDYEGNTPLHLASTNGYTQTMKLLLNVHPSLLDTENNDENTPLHAAAIANKPKSINLLLTSGGDIKENNEKRTFLDIAIERTQHEATLAVINHDRWKEILQLPTRVHGTYTLGLVRYLPDMCLAALDRCTEKSPHDPISADYHVTYHFPFIKTIFDLDAKAPSKPKEDEEEDVPENVKLATIPMSVLLSMVRYERVQCLSHPVCLRFLQMKWSTVGFWLNFGNLLLYASFLACLTSTIIIVGPMPLPLKDNITNSSLVSNYNNSLSEYNTKLTTTKPLMIFLLAFIGFQFLKEFMQMMQMKIRYFSQLSNYLQWVMYTTITLFVLPHILGMVGDWTYNCGVCGLFFSWIYLLLVLQRFEFFGIYVVMFKEILGTLLQVLVVFSILLFAFGITFYAILRNEVDMGYPTIPLSVFTSVIMMVGDINYMDTFVRPFVDDDQNTLRFSAVAFFTMSMFILFIPILLMNLLIGLAVGDIEGVQKNARLKRLAMQVQLIGGMEKKMPKFILRIINKEKITEFPNSACTPIKKWYTDLVNGTNKDNGVSSETKELYEQLAQQKTRLKGLQTEMKSQTELLKLVVAKMEIQTETSLMDEGGQDEGMDIAIILKEAASKSKPNWRNKAVEDVMRKSQVVSKWNKEGEHTLQPSERRCITPLEADHVETNF